MGSRPQQRTYQKNNESSRARGEYNPYLNNYIYCTMIDNPNELQQNSEETLDNFSQSVESEDSVVQAQEEVITDQNTTNQTLDVETVVDSETKDFEGINPSQQEIEELRSQIEQYQQQADSFKNQYLRTVADFDNFRKRSIKQKEELEEQVKCNTINELLPVIDNFERARTQIEPKNDGEMVIHKSYQGIYKQIVEGLKKIGVSAMRPEGQEFDPNLHEAVMREPSSEYPEDTVIEQLVRGYMLGDRVLRHAMVKVAAPGESEPESEEETESLETPESA